MGVAMLGVTFFSLIWWAESERRHSLDLAAEKATTQWVLVRSRIDGARSIIQLHQADSRPRAWDMMKTILAAGVPQDLRAEARDAALAALALPMARTRKLHGKGTDINDWTYATGDLPRSRWALTDFEGHIQLRSLSGPDTTSELFTSPRKVSALIRFSPGGRGLAIRHRDELGICDTTPGAAQPLAFVCKPWGRENPFGFMKMSFAPDDGAVIWPDGPSIVATALPAGTEMARWEVQGEGKARISALAFATGGNFFALSHDHSPTVEVRHWPSGEQKRIFSSQLLRPAVAIAVSPGARWIAAGDESGKITAWRGDIDSERQLEFRGHTDTIRSLAFSRDGRYLASSSEDSMVRFWSIAAESEVAGLAWDVGVPSISDDNLSYGVGAAMDHVASAELGPSPILHRFRPEPGARAMQYVSILPDGNSLWCLSDTGPVHCALPEGELIASHAGTNLEQIIADPAGK